MTEPLADSISTEHASTPGIHTKYDLINRVAKDAQMTQAEARRAVESVIEALKSVEHQSEPLNLRGLGSFHPVIRAPRRSNLATGVFDVPAFKTLKFKASRTLREPV